MYLHGFSNRRVTPRSTLPSCRYYGSLRLRLLPLQHYYRQPSEEDNQFDPCKLGGRNLVFVLGSRNDNPTKAPENVYR